MSVSASPLISVAIPVHNGAAYIGDAIRSVQAQTYRRWQLTVHDNASDDDTAAAVRSFDDERIRLASYDELVPMPQSWDRCLRDIPGEFFQMLCADDFLHEHYFDEKIALAAQPQHADAVLFSSNRTLVNKNGKPLFSIGFSPRAGVFTRDDVLTAMTRKLNPIGDPGTGLARASAIGAFRFGNTAYLDIEFWLHILQSGQMAHLPRNLSFFRISATAASAQSFFSHIRSEQRFYRNMVKPHLSDKKWRYYQGTVNHIIRAIARRLVYLSNR